MSPPHPQSPRPSSHFRSAWPGGLVSEAGNRRWRWAIFETAPSLPALGNGFRWSGPSKKLTPSSSQMYLNCLILPPAPFREMGRKSDLCSTVHGGSCDNFGATGRVSVDGPEDTQPLSQRVRRLKNRFGLCAGEIWGWTPKSVKSVLDFGSRLGSGRVMSGSRSSRGRVEVARGSIEGRRSDLG